MIYTYIFNVTQYFIQNFNGIIKRVRSLYTEGGPITEIAEKILSATHDGHSLPTFVPRVVDILDVGSVVEVCHKYYYCVIPTKNKYPFILVAAKYDVESEFEVEVYGGLDAPVHKIFTIQKLRNEEWVPLFNGDRIIIPFTRVFIQPIPKALAILEITREGYVLADHTIDCNLF